MRHSAEVGIVGAGPAGARAAELLAAQGVDVLLLDPRAPWEKPCGGGLTSPLFDELPELEAVKPLSRPVDLARVELSPRAGIYVHLHEPIWMISRKELGRWQLRRALEAGANHEAVRVRAITRKTVGWQVDTDHGTVELSYLVGADGAASTVRSAAVPEFAVELAPTRVAYPRELGPTPEVLVLRFYRELVGYLWDFPRPDHHSVGIEATNGGWRRPALDGKIDEYRASAGGASSATLPRAGAVIGTAQLGHGDFTRIAGDGFALLGDAAGFADPFTGEGIRNALRSADLFARAWGMGSATARDTYPALARDAFAREFAVARLLRRILNESGLGVRLVKMAISSNVAYAVVAAALNAVSLHERGAGRFFSHYRGALREARARTLDAERAPASDAEGA